MPKTRSHNKRKGKAPAASAVDPSSSKRRRADPPAPASRDGLDEFMEDLTGEAPQEASPMAEIGERQLSVVDELETTENPVLTARPRAASVSYGTVPFLPMF